MAGTRLVPVANVKLTKVTTEEFVVIGDAYCWYEENVPGRPDHCRAYRGQKVELTAEEGDRGLGLHMLARPVDEEDETAYPSDEQLSQMSAEDLKAHVLAVPDDRGRVYALEQGRAGGVRPEIAAIAQESAPIGADLTNPPPTE